jgi:hypothetical protein
MSKSKKEEFENPALETKATRKDTIKESPLVKR